MSSDWRTVTAAVEATVAIGLGSNIGDRFHNLVRALDSLRRQIGALTALSRVYVSEPIGYHDQPHFWNAVALFRTTLAPLSVLEHAKAIERDLGRVMTFADGPRNIDIDILLYDDVVLSTPQLELPHPRMHERAFVLRPLAEIAPSYRHPRLAASMETLRDGVRAQHAAPLAAESAQLRAYLGLTEEGES